MHFKQEVCDRVFFDSLTAEKLVTKFSKGFPKRSWVKIRPRNEVLDTSVYSYAALKIKNPNFERIGERLKATNIRTKLEALKAKLNGEAQKASEAPKDNYAVTMHKKRRAKISTNSNYAKAWRG